MSTSAGHLLDSAHAQMDDLLWRVCEELQLSPTRYDLAVERYESVCRWLEADGSLVASFFPTIYPQGSMQLGTTVKPIGRNEHDLDFVCEFQVPANQFPQPLTLLNLVATRMREHKTYAGILELKNRCVRLNYQDEFHMDILPACPDPGAGDSCLVVPDRKSESWKPSNPKGYAGWFEGRCAVLVQMAERGILSKAEPVPEQERTVEKAPLKRVVQLLKRWRDVRYQKYPDLAPISMVLTTLAAATYRGQWSVSEAISDILDAIIALIDSCKPRIVVVNPANPNEDLSERWNDEVQYAAFTAGMRELHRQWHEVLAKSGIQNVAGALEVQFGETVKAALAKQAQAVQRSRQNQILGVLPSGMLAPFSPGSGRNLRHNTFHGV